MNDINNNEQLLESLQNYSVFIFVPSDARKGHGS